MGTGANRRGRAVDRCVNFSLNLELAVIIWLQELRARVPCQALLQWVSCGQNAGPGASFALSLGQRLPAPLECPTGGPMASQGAH